MRITLRLLVSAQTARPKVLAPLPSFELLTAMAGSTAHGSSGARHNVHPRSAIDCGPTTRRFACLCGMLPAPQGPHAHHMVSMCHARGWRPHDVQHAAPRI